MEGVGQLNGIIDQLYLNKIGFLFCQRLVIPFEWIFSATSLDQFSLSQLGHAS